MPAAGPGPADRWWRGLTARLIAGILGGSLVVYLGILLHIERRVETLLVERARDEAGWIHRGVAEWLDAELRPAEEIPDRLGRLLAVLPLDGAALDEVLRAALANNDALEAVAAIRTAAGGRSIPAADDGTGPVAGVRWSRRGDDLVRRELTFPEGETAPPEWFSRTLRAAAGTWSGPERDPATGDLLLRRASPIGAGRGVVAAEISLARVQAHVASIRVARTGFAFLVGEDGLILAHPDPSLVLGPRLGDLVRSLGNPALTDAVGRMKKGERGFVRAVSPRTGEPAWFFYGPLEALDAAVAVVFPEDEIAADAARLGRRMAILGAAGAGALALIVVGLSVRMTRPLRRLARATREVAAGRLEADLPAPVSGDEIGRLTADFREMQRALVRYVEDQRAAAAAAARLEGQLRVARQIQMAMLPADLPALTRGTGLEIGALLEPALRVGGDLYDVVRQGDDRLVVVVGDVSGKGIPASLFMAMAATLIRTAARAGEPPDAILRRVNDELAASNPGSMFVTLICLAIDLKSGRVTAANAGHLPAILLGDGAPRPVFPIGGMMVGSFPGLEVKCDALELPPGRTLVLYSDGVTEAFDPDDEMFGEARLIATLAASPGGDAGATAATVLEAVRRHARGADQSDDITILALRRPPA